MKISIVIPTLNRHEDLNRAVDSITSQIYLPYEIIIIDQSDNNQTLEIVTLLSENSDQIPIKYIHTIEKSLTKARNIGLKLAKGEIITFLDDDVLLDPNYLKEIVNVFLQQDAVLVGGKIVNWDRKKGNLPTLLNRIFLLTRVKEDSFDVQISFNPTEDYYSSKLIQSQWASGCNHSILASIVNSELCYDEQLIKYALAEDVDFTYRVFKKFGKRLYITPLAMLQHLESPNSRLPNKKKIYMDSVHKRYLYYKNMRQSTTNHLLFLWSRCGAVLKQVMNTSMNPDKQSLLSLKYMIQAERYAIKHNKEIKSLKLDFFSDWLNQG